MHDDSGLTPIFVPLVTTLKAFYRRLRCALKHAQFDAYLHAGHEAARPYAGRLLRRRSGVATRRQPLFTMRPHSILNASERSKERRIRAVWEAPSL
jgi:hypothetical protein